MTAPAPFAPKPSILDRILGRLIPTDQYGDLLDPSQTRGLRAQGLLNLGTGILAQSGPGTGPLQAFGKSYQGLDMQGMADHALKLNAYRKQLANEAAIGEVAAQHPAQPGETPEGTYGRIASIISDLVGKPGTEDLVGKLSNVLAQLRPQGEGRSRRLVRSAINPETGKAELYIIDPDTGEKVPTNLGAVITNVPGGVATESERRAAALLTVGEDAYKQLTDAPAPSVEEAAAAKLPYGMGQGMISAKQQKINQAAAQFYRSYLYIVSGATVNPSEAEEAAKTFTPQYNDDASTVARKAAAREVMLQAMRLAAGRAAPKQATVPDEDEKPRYEDNPY